MNLEGLPGGDLIEAGLQDLRAGRETVSSLIVSIGSPRLRLAGLDVPASSLQPEHRLYLLLRETDPDGAHSRHNALIRRLVSFERALECAS